MPFDIQGARKEGYSDREIAEYLASQRKFDVKGARKEGYSDEEIISHLAGPEPKKTEAYTGPTTFEAKVAKEEPGFVERTATAVKEFFTGPGSVMDKAPAGKPAPDERLELGQGPISQETLRKARDVREGIAKPQDQSAVVQRTAEALEQKGEPTFRGLVDRAMEPERIVEEAESQRRKQVARDNPLLSSLTSGTATTLSGGLNVASVAADAFNQTFVNPFLTVAGLDPLPKTPTAYGTEYLAKAAEDYMPEVGKQKLGEAFDKGQATQWLFSNLAANSPQIALSLVGAYAPALRASILPAMGATAAGTSYAGGDDSRVALAKGAVEVVTEMLPLQVFDKVGDILKGMSLPKQKTVLAIAGQRLVKAGADITAISLTNAIEEAAAQFGGNVLDKYFQGKDVKLTDDLLEASVLGAASGTAMSLPRTAGTLVGRGEPLTPEQQIAQEIEAGVAQAQPAGVNEAAIRALNPQTYDQTLVTPEQTVNRSAQIDALSQATSVDEVVAAATALAGTIEGAVTPQAELVTPALETVTPQPELVTPALETVTPQVQLPEPDVALEQQFGLDKLRQAPRPQRIQGQAVADLSDDDLRAVVENDSAPAITRRGAQVELAARASEVAATTPEVAKTAPEPARILAPEVAATSAEVASTTPEVSRETSKGFIDIPADASTTALPDADSEPVGGVAAADQARTTAQADLDRWAAAENETAPVLNPAPAEEDAAVNQIANALNSQFGGRIYAFHDTQPMSVNGFALGGTAFVNTASPDINVGKTSLHEFKHTVEQIAEAERRQGLTDTPAQQFTSSIDSVFSDMTEEGKRAYAENFLHKAELDAITDPFAREIRLRELLQAPMLLSEMTADFLGNRATDKAFWQDVARSDPQGFKGFVDKWIGIIDNLLTSLRGPAAQKKGETAKVDQYVRDLKKAKVVARDALIAYRRGTLQQAAPEAGAPSLSLREGEVSEANVPTGGEGVQPSPERAGPATGEDGRSDLPSYGEAREGAISVVGRHYSPRVQTGLSSAYYGTGLRGAEGSRLRESKDSRISNRIYFYVDTGNGIRPESGVGRFAHEVQLNNIYDPSTRLIPPQPNSNAFESAVIDAGFDGYIAPFGRGAAVVLLGPKHGAVPVKSLEQAPAFAKKQKTAAIGDYETVPQKDGGIMVQGDVEAIRAIMPEGVVGRPVEGGVMFTPANAPRVRAALEGRKLAYSRAGAVLEKLPMKDGKYVGAPLKYNTPGKIAALRKNLRKLTKEGEAGRYWYENSSRAILRMTGGNVQEARKFVALLAIYSPQAKVDANSTFALRAWAQYKAGQPISVKTGVMDAKAKAAMEDVDAYWSGEKTGNFFNNLLREIDPSTAGKQGATIDMWMMRAAEYPTDAPNPNQYSFMENETNAIAKELGWEPQQVQAAIWVAMKARMENPGVKKRTEASSEKNGWIRYDYPLKNGKPTKTRVILNAQKHRDNWLREAFAHDPTKEDTQLAKFDFEDGVMRHLGQVSFEARPGRSTGVLPGIHDAPYAQQVEFQQAVQAAFLEEDGGDRLAQLLGLLIDTQNVLAPGVWQGEVSPSSQKLVAMAPAKGEEGKGAVDPAQAEALNLYAAVAGLVARQEGVGWHRPFFAGTKGKANGLDINLGRVINPAEAVDLERAIGVWMENNDKAEWQDSFAIISSPTGVRLVNFGIIPNNTLQSEIVKVAESALPDFDYRVFASSGDMPTNNWKENPNGESYIQRLSAAGRSDVLDWARTVLAPRVQSVFDEYSKKYDWGDPGKISFSARQRGREVARETPQVTPVGLESLFEGLNARGLKRTRAQATVSARPDAARITYVQDNFIDILSELEDSGKVKINCD